LNTIHVSASREYDVIIARGVLSELGTRTAEVVRGRSCIVVSDSNVAPLYLGRAVASLKEAGFTVGSFSFPAGEESKNGQTYLTLLNFLAQKQLTRADALVALGGGVVGDLTGFAAATYLRGVALVQVPTTLLACVDSSVGGKTAIDLPAGKNLAGAFYQPSLVLCDPDVIQTLPAPVFSDGCAEVIKYGMLGSCELLDRLLAAPVAGQLEYIISKCVEMKRDIVEGDEFDTGRRQLLNLGHTFGHSIEKLSNFGLSHGSAVAIGMALITRAAIKKGLCPAECLDVLLRLLDKCALPCECSFPPEAIAQVALSDKKRSGSSLNLAVPCAMGDAKLVRVPVSEIIDWVKAGMNP